jgi:hypothetical protein
MKKKIITAISILLGLLLLLYIFKDAIIKSAIEGMVGNTVGLRLKIKGLKADIFKASIDIKGLQLFNPRGFPDRLMADIPQIYIDYNPDGLFKNKVHIRKARIELNEFLVVKNKDGILNLRSLKTIPADQKKKKPTVRASSLQIDVLELKIGRAVYKDYTKGEPPIIKEFNINLDEKYTNITDIRVLVNLIVAKALARTTIAELANFNLEILRDSISRVSQATGDIASRAVDTAGKALGAAGEKFKEVFQFPFQEKEE